MAEAPTNNGLGPWAWDHRAKIDGVAAQNREEHPYFEGWVRGMIAYVAMVNPERGRELLTEFELRKR